MLKPILSSSLLLSLLCAPALADSPSTTTYVVELATKTTRHTVLVADRSCGEVQIKSAQRESFLRVCAHEVGKHVRLELDRRTRDNTDEAHQAAVVVATSGSTFDLLDGKLSVKTQ